MDQSLTERIIGKGVGRTAPATPGLLINWDIYISVALPRYPCVDMSLDSGSNIKQCGTSDRARKTPAFVAKQMPLAEKCLFLAIYHQ